MKMNLKNSLLLFLLLCSSTLVAQEFTLSGYMRDADSGEELLYATVAVQGTSQGVATNHVWLFLIDPP
jgi:hypothetical protein